MTNALKGHAMNRGTLMVLKRLIVTTLGAFGMGALLAVGPVSAQQIPAPDAYGDPQACAASIKAAAAAAPDTGEVGDDGLTPTQRAALTSMARSCTGDVGAGIAKARTLYKAAVDAKSEMDDAQKAYDADDSARNLEDLTEAMTAHTAAVTARNAYSAGSAIYEAVYAEEGELADAREAQGAWMMADTAATAAEALRDTVELENYITDFAGFDATGQAYEFETYTVKTTADNPDTADEDETAYTTYVRVKKQGGATVGPQTVVDADGNPVLDGDGDPTYAVPDALDAGLARVMPDGMPGGNVSFVLEEDFDHDLDDTTDGITFLRVSSVGDILEDSTIAGVNMDYMTAKMTLATAEKALADNQDGTLTIGLTETVRRAQAQYDFFAAQKARVEKSLAAGDLVVDRPNRDNPATPNEVETDFTLEDTPYTVEDYEALTDLQEAADDAADDLKDAYDDRVAATDDLETKQRDTQTYLEQLVALRGYQKDAADAAAPEDAEEPTAAQMSAAEKLATAEAQLATFNELQALGEDNPVKALVNSLLEADGDDGDDDGQALVDAIDATYQTANDAMTAVEGLGGDEGTVAQNTAAIGALSTNTDDGDEMDGPITANTKAIAQETQDRMAADVGLGMRIDTNWDAIAVNQMDIDDLEAEDVRLEGRIDTNWDAIAVNQMDIDDLEAEDVRLEGRIDTNWDAIAVNQTDIDANETAIGNNTTSITTNSTMIGENASAISRNSGMITDNRNMIGELSESLDVVRAGVAASMALAGMPAINGRGISIGVGSYDGESAFAVGFQIQGEMASFQIGVTSSGGETGASAGVGFQF